MLFNVRKNDRVLATVVNGEKKQNDIYAKLLMPFFSNCKGTVFLIPTLKPQIIFLKIINLMEWFSL